MNLPKLPKEHVHLLAIPGPRENPNPRESLIHIPDIDHDGPIAVASFRRKAGQKKMKFEQAWGHQGNTLSKYTVPRRLRKMSSINFVYGSYGVLHKRNVFTFLDHTIYGYPERLIEGAADHFIISRDFIFHRIQRPGDHPATAFVGATRHGPYLRHLDPLHKVTALYLRTHPPENTAHAKMTWNTQTNNALSIIRAQGFTQYETVSDDITWLPEKSYAALKTQH